MSIWLSGAFWILLTVFALIRKWRWISFLPIVISIGYALVARWTQDPGILKANTAVAIVCFFILVLLGLFKNPKPTDMNKKKIAKLEARIREMENERASKERIAELEAKIKQMEDKRTARSPAETTGRVEY